MRSGRWVLDAGYALVSTVMATVSFRLPPVWPEKLGGHWRHSERPPQGTVVDWTADPTAREVSIQR